MTQSIRVVSRRASLLGCGLLLIAAAAGAQSYTFRTFAGNMARGSEDGTGSTARFHFPRGVATDSGGNVYVADPNNNTIRKITPAGVVTTLAGLAGTGGSADGTGGAARFNSPGGVATDSGGNVYVADRNNHTIRKITPAGVVTTLAGLAGTAGSLDGTGSAARFQSPRGVATDSGGNVYVADSSSNTIRRITPAGVVTTLAGLAGTAGSLDGTGSDARFNFPFSVATDSGGNVYVADRGNHTIRKITPAGVVTTLAGLAGTFGPEDGTGSGARFNFPSGVATDSGGNVYVGDDSNHTIRKITPGGGVTTLAGLAGFPGSLDGTGSAARFDGPTGVATDSGGNVYVGDQSNHTIRKITPGGVVTTLAGLAGGQGSADGTGSAARFNGPTGVATDSGSNVYVGDQSNHTIRKITPGGVVTTLAGLAGAAGSADGTGSLARFNFPYGVAADGAGNVYVADRGNHTIRTITPAGAVTTLAGLAGAAGNADGTASLARFNQPFGVAIDGAGNVYVADYLNHTIRKINSLGVVTTLAGQAGTAGSADGTGSTAAFNHPVGVTTDSGGNVYVADHANHTIRKITPDGVVTTLAGQAGTPGSADGTGSAARFRAPTSLATDGFANNVYVADRDNQTIRRITPMGEVTTLGGLAGTFGSLDGTGSGARFSSPSGVAVDSGNVFVADTDNHVIRVGNVALADVATIDFATGTVGATRQLGTSPQTATMWQWTLIRRPASSSAQLSSSTARNPVFTPDVADVYTFRLVASTHTSSSSSISTVDLTVTPASSATAVTSTPNPSVPAQSVTFTATVTSAGGTPTGTVTFRDGATTIGTGSLSGGQATFVTSALALGSHSITAMYAGDPNFTGSTSPALTHSVQTIAAPAGFNAIPGSTTSVSATWQASSGAASYEIARSSSGTSYVIIGTSTSTSFLDSAVSPDSSYLYKVRAVSGAGDRSPYSPPDLATTVIFTDDPLVTKWGTIVVKAVHVQELRTAAQAMLRLANLPPASFTDPSLGQTVMVKATHISELRTEMDRARTALGLPPWPYSDTTLTVGVTLIRGVHIVDLRHGANIAD